MSADAKHLKEPFSLREDEVDEFVTHYFPKCSKVLYVGNIGFSPDVLYFPNLMRHMPNIDFRFMEETRCEGPIGCFCSSGLSLRDWELPHPQNAQGTQPDEHP